MKKNVLLVVAFFTFSQILVAQAPILTEADFNTNVFYGLVNTASSNQEPYMYWVSVPVSSVPGSSNFPNATSALKRIDNSGSCYYILYETTTTYHKQIASGCSALVADSKLLFQLPFALNNSFTITFPSGQTSVTYLGYEDYTTPWETCSNAVKVSSNTVSQGPNYVNSIEFIATNPYRVLYKSSIFFGEAGSNSYSMYYKYFPYESYQLNSEEFKAHSFSMFPNPTSSDFIIHNDDAFTQDSFVTIYNVLGKIVLPKQLLKNEMQTIYSRSLDAGLYFVKITNKENQILQTEKIIKQ